jgi:uncharacterized protein
MDIDAITHLAFQTFGTKKSHSDREKGYTFFHGQRVAKLAITLRQLLLPDNTSKDAIIYVGALFHDAEKGNEPHNETGAALVQRLLPAYYSSQEVVTIAEIVRQHNQRDGTHDPFIQLVQDADVLDHEGTLGLWLLFSVTASIGESVPHAIEFWVRQRKDDTIAPKLNYELSRKIFSSRRAYYDSVLERLAQEANGDIPQLEAM